jgi:hypothetical protein
MYFGHQEKVDQYFVVLAVDFGFAEHARLRFSSCYTVCPNHMPGQA